MKLLAHKLIQLDIGWNEHRVNEARVFELCEAFDVVVIEEPLETKGFYYRLLGRDFIVIDSKLSGIEKLFVLLHELGHFLLHVPHTGAAANFFEVGRSTRKEREADLFALCALLPNELVDRRGHDGLIADGYAIDLVERRLKIRKRHGF